MKIYAPRRPERLELTTSLVPTHTAIVIPKEFPPHAISFLPLSDLDKLISILKPGN